MALSALSLSLQPPLYRLMIGRFNMPIDHKISKKRGSKCTNGHPKRSCNDDIGLYAQNRGTILDVIVIYNYGLKKVPRVSVVCYITRSPTTIIKKGCSMGSPNEGDSESSF